jgi:deoxyribonuclease-4
MEIEQTIIYIFSSFITIMFINDQLRIGPPAVRDDLFFMANGKGGQRKGKREEIPNYLASLGLNAYEFSAGRMASFSDNETYELFRANVEKFNIAMSIHAPYYISLTSEKPETYEKSIERVADVYAWAVWLRATRIVIHPGTYSGKRNLNLLIQMIVDGIKRGITLSYEKYPDLKNQFKQICICMETMGKPSQLGPTEEIIQLCKDIGTQYCRPCIDFGHLYARNLGKIDGRPLYEQELTKIEQELGHEIVQNLHIHYSHIEFTDKGEKEHVPNTDQNYGPHLRPLLEIIKENGYTPTIINESPELEPDAKLIMDEWQKINKK